MGGILLVEYWLNNIIFEMLTFSSESHRRMVLHGSRPSTLSVSSDSDSLLATPAAVSYYRL